MNVWWVYLAPPNIPSAILLTLGNKVVLYYKGCDLNKAVLYHKGCDLNKAVLYHKGCDLHKAVLYHKGCDLHKAVLYHKGCDLHKAVLYHKGCDLHKAVLYHKGCDLNKAVLYHKGCDLHKAVLYHKGCDLNKAVLYHKGCDLSKMKRWWMNDVRNNTDGEQKWTKQTICKHLISTKTEIQQNDTLTDLPPLWADSSERPACKQQTQWVAVCSGYAGLHHFQSVSLQCSRSEIIILMIKAGIWIASYLTDKGEYTMLYKTKKNVSIHKTWKIIYNYNMVFLTHHTHTCTHPPSLTNSKHWFTTSFLQPLPYLVMP